MSEAVRFIVIGALSGIAAGFFGIGAFFANRIAGPVPPPHVRIFVMLLGGYLNYGAVRRLGWV